MDHLLNPLSFLAVLLSMDAPVLIVFPAITTQNAVCFQCIFYKSLLVIHDSWSPTLYETVGREHCMEYGKRSGNPTDPKTIQHFTRRFQFGLWSSQESSQWIGRGI